MDADGKNVRQLTHAPGCYNGGPFFSPDGKRVIFRSDRKKKDHLQLYVINVDGTGERALTDNENWVFWAPFWYKDSTHIVYTAADHSNPKMRPNYDLYWRSVDDQAAPVRLTFFPGADVLPVFSPDGTKVMWTATRGGDSQLWMADLRGRRNAALHKAKAAAVVPAVRVARGVPLVRTRARPGSAFRDCRAQMGLPKLAVRGKWGIDA